MDYISNILLAYSIYAIGTMSPGPATLSTMTIAARYGRNDGLKYATGILTGSLIWGVLAAIGLSTIISHYSNALYVFKLSGGFYLLWLSYKSIKSVWMNSSTQESQGKISQKFYLRGLALHLTNPKPIFVWSAIFAVAITPDSPSWMLSSILIGCAIIGTIVFYGYAIVFSTTQMTRWYLSVKRQLEGVMAAVFGLAGIKLMTSDI